MFGIQLEITTVVLVSLGLVLGYLIPWLRSKAKGTQWEHFISIVAIIVQSIEQRYRFINYGPGDKLRHASRDIKLVCDQCGLKYDYDTIVKAIEAAVLNLPQSTGQKLQNKE